MTILPSHNGALSDLNTTSQLSVLDCQTNAALQQFNTFGIDAKARYYLVINDDIQLPALCALLQQAPWRDMPRLVLGGGSNLILTQDFDGLVIHVALKGRARFDEADMTYISGAAGENWHDFVQWTLAQNVGGLENLSLIPGTVGAAPIQNIGAYGVEVKDVLCNVHWLEFATGKTHILTQTDCQFAYRDSIFKGALKDKGMIIKVTFALPKQWQPRVNYGDVAQHLSAITKPSPQQVSDVICSIRRSKLPDPAVIGNVGSFFKNPIVASNVRQNLQVIYPQMPSYAQTDGRYKLAAGWLIEQAGWKGRQIGQVGVYQKQALVLVNLGGATGAEVAKLAAAIQADVLAQFGVALETEPVFV